MRTQRDDRDAATGSRGHGVSAAEGLLRHGDVRAGAAGDPHGLREVRPVDPDREPGCRLAALEWGADQHGGDVPSGDRGRECRDGGCHEGIAVGHGGELYGGGAERAE